ncbi:MAG: helix-turn-helix transcriptional regulator [Clostridia bacterium]|nr:helix-turn-helix transcriptional regulator [Clostridia bacterium]
MITNQEITKIFAERINDYMIENGMNIKQFAEFVQLPRRTVNSWMLNNRTPRIDYIYHVANCLKCSIDYLVGKEN